MNYNKDEFGFPNLKLMIEDILLYIIFKHYGILSYDFAIPKIKITIKSKYYLTSHE